MAQEILYGITGNQQAAYFDESVQLWLRVSMPERELGFPVVRVDLRGHDLFPEFREELESSPVKFSGIIQFNPDRITVQTRPSRVPATPGMPRFRVKRYKLNDLPVPPDHQMGGSSHVRAGQVNRRRLGSKLNDLI